MARNDLLEYLASNPRMMGVLFVLTILLAEAGSVAADSGGSIPGP